MYFWPTLYTSLDERLYVRRPHRNSFVERFWPGQWKWQPVRKIWFFWLPVYVRTGDSFFDWPTCFERVE